MKTFRLSIALLLAGFTGVACNGSGSASASAGGGAGSGAGGRGGRGGRGDTVLPVVVAKVVQRDVPVTISTIGNVEASTTNSVRAQVTGELMEVHFVEGAFVKSGDKLFTIDERPFRAALQQAQANLTKDQALLNQAQATLVKDQASTAYAKQQADHLVELAGRSIISKDQADQAVSAYNASLATVSADGAAIESARATLDAQQFAVDTAKLQLEYCVIRARISGRTGNLNTKAGNLVAAGSQELVTITQIEPVFVTFSVPSLHLQDIKRHMSAGEKMPVVATPQDANSHPADGHLSFIDNAVDQATDTIKLKATFDNKDRELWPGQFARVSLQLTTLAGAMVVPSQAVQTGQDGQFVFVVKADQTVEQRPVTTGATADQDIVITKGLKPGETVVTEGQLRLEPGVRVTPADPRTGEAAPGGRGRGGRGGRGGPGGPGGGTGGDSQTPGRGR